MALDARKGEETAAELASGFEVHATMINHWGRALGEDALGVLERGDFPLLTGPPLLLGNAGSKMGVKRYRPESIVTKLRQVEGLCGQGMPRIDAIRQVQITQQTFYRCRKQYGGMGTDQLKELKRLQKENERLPRAVSDLTHPLGISGGTQRRRPLAVQMRVASLPT